MNGTDFKNDYNISMLETSWFDLGHVLYVDNPVGTGFSYGDSFANSLDEAGADFYSFLTNLFV